MIGDTIGGNEPMIGNIYYVYMISKNKDYIVTKNDAEEMALKFKNRLLVQSKLYLSIEKESVWEKNRYSEAGFYLPIFTNGEDNKVFPILEKLALELNSSYVELQPIDPWKK